MAIWDMKHRHIMTSAYSPCKKRYAWPKSTDGFPNLHLEEILALVSIPEKV